jgi:hypothetical protein
VFHLTNFFVSQIILLDLDFAGNLFLSKFYFTKTESSEQVTAARRREREKKLLH